jgi:hypothetical protein
MTRRGRSSRLLLISYVVGSLDGPPVGSSASARAKEECERGWEKLGAGDVDDAGIGKKHWARCEAFPARLVVWLRG